MRAHRRKGLGHNGLGLVDIELERAAAGFELVHGLMQAEFAGLPQQSAGLTAGTEYLKGGRHEGMLGIKVASVR
jgi:hypothetical protein